ncbi:hypothetical protein DFR49_0031 [Hephaestia caeni]|uniref:WD40 repeat protein n=1 Tax=Hephaestia caeni TaxID=645617 RepID=A0A397PIL8_9SPHN|nr:hypothetical protein [Hephaestia caeni]RIA45511.1 hypothetical protein DFR49_0031 [Hephaestia caeni]
MNRTTHAILAFALLAGASIMALPASAQEARAPDPAATAVPSVTAVELVRWPAAEARQGVAADKEYFYPNANNRIGKYDRKTGRRVAQWEGPRALFPHMNSCVVEDRELICAASNHPSVPMASVIEVFDTATLRHVRSIALPPIPGSLTWIERKGDDWYGGFANYPVERGGEPGHDNRWTRLVRFDSHFRATGSWLFPDAVLARFAPMSNSGGSWGDDGLLYVTGHDRPEAYVMRLPKAGSVLEHVATVALPTAGQAIAWDRTQPRVLWSLDRATNTVVASRVPPVPVTP